MHMDKKWDECNKKDMKLKKEEEVDLTDYTSGVVVANYISNYS